MKLSELVSLHNKLTAYTVTDINRDADLRAKNIIYELQRSPEQIDNYLQILSNNAQTITQAFDQFEKDLLELKQSVKELIRNQETEWLQKSYTFYEQTLERGDSQRPEAVGYNRNKRVLISNENEQFLRSRVARYSDWHHPAMIIHPMFEPFMQDLVSSDPLYLIDESAYLLEPVLAQYNELYQRRLRTYVIKESFDYPILDKLPQGQFGLCFVYNYLNFRPFEIIKKYLAEIYQKLSPGGILVMTFNDCERASAVELVEMNYGCYTPSYLVEQLADTLGYEIVYKWTDGGPSTWIELKRPGQLSSLRGGQALATVMPKTTTPTASETLPVPNVDQMPSTDQLRTQVLALQTHDPDLVRHEFDREKLLSILNKHAKRLTKSVAKSK